MSAHDVASWLADTSIAVSLLAMATLGAVHETVDGLLSLLLWSALCFVGLSVNNVLLFFDLVVFPTELDLRPYRLLSALAGLLFLLYGFIWEAE